MAKRCANAPSTVAFAASSHESPAFVPHPSPGEPTTFLSLCLTTGELLLPQAGRFLTTERS